MEDIVWWWKEERRSAEITGRNPTDTRLRIYTANPVSRHSVRAIAKRLPSDTDKQRPTFAPTPRDGPRGRSSSCCFFFSFRFLFSFPSVLIRIPPLASEQSLNTLPHSSLLPSYPHHLPVHSISVFECLAHHGRLDVPDRNCQGWRYVLSPLSHPVSLPNLSGGTAIFGKLIHCLLGLYL